MPDKIIHDPHCYFQWSMLSPIWLNTGASADPPPRHRVLCSPELRFLPISLTPPQPELHPCWSSSLLHSRLWDSHYLNGIYLLIISRLTSSSQLDISIWMSQKIASWSSTFSLFYMIGWHLYPSSFSDQNLKDILQDWLNSLTPFSFMTPTQFISKSGTTFKI